jgi:hypothetical protein
MVIDFHAHYPNEPDFLPRLLDLLPRAGIDRICLCSAGEMFGHVTNDVVRLAFERHPDRIIGLAFLDLGRDKPEVVDEYVAQGFRGFKIHNPAAPYDDKAFYPIYERIEGTGLPALFHTGIVMCTCHDKERDVSSDKMRPVRLDAVVRAFKGMNVVGAHLGVPWYEEASMMARMHPNYHVDLTGAYWGGWRANKGPDFYRYHFFWENAWEKVLFGTDILHADELLPSKQFHDNFMRQLGLSQEVCDKVYGGNAARLLRLDS